MPRGGRRPGAGRPKKTTEERVLGGWAGHRENASTKRAKVAAAKGRRAPRKRPKVRQPIDLAPEQATVWSEIAPFATKLGTLTDVSVLAFRELCEAIAVKRALLRQVTAEGWTVASPSGDSKAHPLLVRYQGIYQRVEAGLTRFGLAPMGEEMGFGKAPVDTPTPETERDPFAEFDGPAH